MRALLFSADQSMSAIVALMKQEKLSAIKIDITDQVTRPLMKLIIVEHFYRRPYDELRDAINASYVASIADLIHRVFDGGTASLDFAQETINDAAEILGAELGRMFIGDGHESDPVLQYSSGPIPQENQMTTVTVKTGGPNYRAKLEKNGKDAIYVTTSGGNPGEYTTSVGVTETLIITEEYNKDGWGNNAKSDSQASSAVEGGDNESTHGDD